MLKLTIRKPTISNLINLTFETSNPIRIIDQNGEFWFVANDVCNILEHSNTSEALKSLDDDEKAKLDTTSSPKLNLGLDHRAREINIINESGLYALILRSRKAMEKGTVQHKFRKWVTSEVLPTIRKTGSYQTPAQRTATPAELQAIKTKVHFISDNFHFKNGASDEIYNRLRVELHLPNIADIQPHQLDRAYAILDEIARHAKSYAEFRYELDKLAQGAIIRQGRPYTPHIKKALTKLGTTIGHAPDWQALQTLIR